MLGSSIILYSLEIVPSTLVYRLYIEYFNSVEKDFPHSHRISQVKFLDSNWASIYRKEKGRTRRIGQLFSSTKLSHRRRLQGRYVFFSTTNKDSQGESSPLMPWFPKGEGQEMRTLLPDACLWLWLSSHLWVHIAVGEVLNPAPSAGIFHGQRNYFRKKASHIYIVRKNIYRISWHIIIINHETVLR